MAVFPQESKPPISAEIIVQGIKSSRLQWPASKLELDLKYISPRRSLTNSTSMSVGFVDEYRIFEGTSRGKIHNKSSKNLYNGDYAIVYDGDQHLEIRTLGKVGVDYLFDPRLIGITANYGAHENIDERLPINLGEQNLRTVSEEIIDGFNAFVVEFTDKYDQNVKIWVGSGGDFKVRKYTISNTTRSSVVRNLYNNNNFPWLPTTSEVRTYNNQTGEIVGERLIVVKDFKLSNDPNINDKMGLSLINPNIGTQIIDTRVSKLLGVWDGNKIVDALPSPADKKPGGANRFLPWLDDPFRE